MANKDPYLKAICHVFAAPALFFLSIVLFMLTAFSMIAITAKSTSFVVLSCLLFILGYNAFRYALKLKNY